MPLFDYRCNHCRKKFSLLVGVTADSPEPACPRCGSRDATKLISRFSRIRSEDEALDSLEESALGADMDDPRSMSRWMREMSKEMGEDVGDELDEYMEDAERELYDGEESAEDEV